jgi:TolB-like protein/tRNA A-37 threonylcarbamoyl transferase component Bud32
MDDSLRDRLQTTLGNAYALERELGGGGMSRVFVGEETSLGRKVVVKVLPPDLAASVNVERFRREIQLAARLQHPHIVPVLAAGVSDGLPYYTMPLIEGESLRSRLARSGELPVQEAAKILRDVLGALSYAHHHGVVHRDIKPDNVLLTGNHAVVADFGVAKALSASTSPGTSLTSLGVALGTPAYMSPEQATADPTTDHRADLYSVGAMAYEMLTGHQVFSARSPQAMLAAHAVETPEPIDKRRPSVPRELASLVMRALEKHAADRPQSADEMLAELEAAVTPSGATTPHVGAIRPRGRRLTMALGAGLIVLALASSAWYLRQARTPVAAAAATDSIASLAVLPFENLGSAGDAYFADGMTEEISSRLGTLSGLRMIGRQSAKSYAGTAKPVAQIGKELGVGYLLTGTVRWDRSRPGHELVRVSPALLRASDGAQLWSEPYQDEVTGVFEIQGKVAERVAQALRMQLTERQHKTLASAPTTNVKAYDYYLRGMTREAGSWDPTEWARVLADYQQAISLDPGFALAHAALARAHLGLYWFRGDPSPRRLELAKAAANRALALAPNLAAAHLALADYYYHGKLDYPHALEAIATAQRLTPNDPEALRLKALIERRQNRWDEAIADQRRGLALDPRNTALLSDLCETLLLTHRHDDPQDACARFALLAPEKPNGHDFLSRAAILRSGNVNAALLILEKARQQIGDEALVAGLLSPESRTVWPAVLNPELARRMVSFTVPATGPQRTGYLANKLVLAVYRKDSSAMRHYSDSILLTVPAALRGNFFDSELYAARSLAYAAKADRAKALAEGRRAMEIVPLQRDALRGAANLVLVTRAAVLAGANDEALSMLRELMAIPNELSPASLRVDPWFDPLRGDPRFVQLVAGG